MATANNSSPVHQNRSTMAYALIGISMTLPFVGINMLLATHHTPWVSIIHSNDWWLKWALMVLMLGGAVVSGWPMWSLRRWIWFNASVSVLVASASLLLISAFGAEAIRCELMNQFNCD